FFGREERLEDMGLRVAVHSAAGVSYRQFDVGSRWQRLNMVQGAFRELDLGCLDRDGASLYHRVSRIQHEIHQPPLPLGLVGADMTVRGIKSDDQADV